MSTPSNHRQQKGVALVMVLTFLVMITIVVVALITSMRLDRPAARSFLNRAKAQQFAQMGVDTVVGTMRTYTANSSVNWITQPGQLVASATNPGSSLALVVAVPLHSGDATADFASLTNALRPPNLNIATFKDPANHLLTDAAAAGAAAPVMPVRWIHVRDNGALETNRPPNLTDTANPIVGRFAYWTDDESSKVNYNIAWGRSGANSNVSGHPTRIELRALTNEPAVTQEIANAIRSTVVNNNGQLIPPANAANNYSFFNSPSDARRVTNAAAALAANKFDVTHYNHDPNTTFFNEPRIVLTTRPDRAGWTYTNGQWVGQNGLPGTNGRPYYIRVLADEGTLNDPLSLPSLNSARDPGAISSGGGVTARLSATRVSETINFLITYLKRTDWPMTSGTGSSFQEKYYGGYPTSPVNYKDARLAQLAINIIDYVRSKESPADFVEPIRAERQANGSFTVGGAPTTAESYIGQTRGPRVTEVAYWQNPANDEAKWKIEVFLPRNYGIASVDLTKFQLILLDSFNVWSAPGGINQLFLDVGSSAAPASAPTLSAGQYSTITVPGQNKNGSTVPPVPLNPRPTSRKARVTLSLKSPAARCSLSPLATIVANPSGPGNYKAVQATYLDVPLDADTTPEAEITSLEVDDPRLNLEARNWTRSTRNSLGAVNSASALSGSKAVSMVQPQQDANASGLNISTASLYMPPPAGKKFTLASGVIDDNSLGMVTSAAELGYIHTGIESTYIDGQGQILPTGVPWRTMRLQPNDQAASVVPDWAFMDLFTAPVATPKGGEYVYAPGAGVVGREQSVGGRVNLNAKPVPFQLERLNPLAAVLQGARTNFASANRLTAVDAAALAANIYAHTLADDGKSYNSTNALYSPGQVVEIKGIADRGEESEELVRSVGNLFTARGNVFTVYSIGQSLKQTPAGELLITGERRLQVMVERFTEKSNNITSTRFSPVYFRSLMP